MSSGLPSIYHDREYNLYYIFTSSGELDLTTIRNIRVDGWSLYRDGDDYALKNPARVVRWYTTCNRKEFVRWYERQNYLGVFIRANGIPGNFCSPLPRQEAVRHEQIIPSAPPASAAPAPAPAPPVPSAPPQQPPPQPKPTKAHIVTLVLRHAIQEGRICPITHDPITESSTCIAPCYHSFNTEAITSWLTANTTCPECREVCV